MWYLKVPYSWEGIIGTCFLEELHDSQYQMLWTYGPLVRSALIQTSLDLVVNCVQCCCLPYEIHVGDVNELTVSQEETGVKSV